jgi:undecaprenyl-diphosphatase
MDKTLLFLINRAWTNPFLDKFMATITNFAAWFPLLVLIVVLIFWRGGFRGRSFLLATLLCIGFTDGIFTQLGKRLVNRPRPSQALANVREVSLAKTQPAFLGVFRPVHVANSADPVEELGGRSFPSGHAMNNAVLATMLILFFGRWGALYVVPAALIAYSRIYCGSHWPSDILVSIVFGVGFAMCLASVMAAVYRLVGPRWLPRLYRNHPFLLSPSVS